LLLHLSQVVSFSRRSIIAPEWRGVEVREPHTCFRVPYTGQRLPALSCQSTTPTLRPTNNNPFLRGLVISAAGTAFDNNRVSHFGAWLAFICSRAREWLAFS
jgi:hypothetical protein